MRGFLIFAAIVVLVSIAFFLHPSQYHQQPECAKVNHQQIVSLGGALERNEMPDESVEKKRKEYHDKREFAAICSDLAAQWSVANKTWRGFWIGLIGLLALIWTLWETRKAANAAAETLNVARETLRETKSDSKRELRAYLAVSGCNIDVFEVGKTLRVSMCYDNSGTTPAYRVGFAAERGFNEVEGVDRGFVTRSDMLGPNSGKCMYIESEEVITEELKTLLIEGRSYFLIDAVFTYEDTFGDEWDYRVRMYAGKEAFERASSSSFEHGTLNYRSEVELEKNNRSNYPKKWNKLEIERSESE